MAFVAPSAAELEKRGNFKPLQKDQYLVTVLTIKEEVTPNPYNKTEEHPEGVPRPQIKVEMRVDGYKDDQTVAVVDIEDNEVKDPKLFAFLDLTKYGMKPRPSLTRQFITSAQRIPLTSDLDVESWDELLGAQLIASAEPTEKGRTKVTAFDPPKSRRRGPSATPEMTPPSIPDAPAETTVLPGETVKRGRKPAAAAPVEEDASPEDDAIGMLGATF